MNSYTTEIKNELIKLQDIIKIKKIKKTSFNSATLPDLEMSEDLVNDIRDAWCKAGVFKRKNSNGKTVHGYCTRLRMINMQMCFIR